MAANESIRPLEFDDDEEDEEMYNAYDDDQVEEMCDAAGSGRWKGLADSKISKLTCL